MSAMSAMKNVSLTMEGKTYPIRFSTYNKWGKVWVHVVHTSTNRTFEFDLQNGQTPEQFFAQPNYPGFLEWLGQQPA